MRGRHHAGTVAGRRRRRTLDGRVRCRWPNGSWSGSTTAAPEQRHRPRLDGALPGRPARGAAEPGDGRPGIAVEALAEAFDDILDATGTAARRRCAPSASTPPARPAPTASSPRRGSTNFSHPAGGVSTSGRRSRPARRCRSSTTTTATRPRSMPITCTSAPRPRTVRRSPPSSAPAWAAASSRPARSCTGAAGMAGELGHVHIPMDGLLGEGQPVPRCNCGFAGDAESVASLTGIEKQPAALLADPVSRITSCAAPADRQGRQAGPRATARRATRWRCKIFEQQAMAIGRLFTIAANFTDPNAYFVGGGVVETAPQFRDWFLARSGSTPACARSRRAVAAFALVPGPRHGRRPRLGHRRARPPPSAAAADPTPRPHNLNGIRLVVRGRRGRCGRAAVPHGERGRRAEGTG